MTTLAAASPAVSFRTPVLPWTISSDDEARFRRITGRVLLICAVIFIALPWLPVFKPDPAKAPELAAPMARLLIEQAAIPPPPPPVVKVQPEVAKPVERDAATKKPEPEKPASRKPSAPAKVALNKEAPVPEARVPVPDKPPGEVDAARRKVAGIGLLAMKDDVQELHGAPVAVQLRTDIKQGPGVGTSTGVGVGAGNEAGVPTRNLITSNATGGSGGINTAAYSKNTGGGGLAGRSTTMVEGVIGGGGGGGAGGGGARGRGDGTGSGIGGSGGNGTGSGPGGAGGNVAKGGGGKASRSIEDVRLVFERNKGSIYAIYNRALREEPGLQGKVVLKLSISPEGQVTEVRIESSDLKAPELEAKLLARIRQFDFGAKDVNQMIVSYPVDFLPS